MVQSSNEWKWSEGALRDLTERLHVLHGVDDARGVSFLFSAFLLYLIFVGHVLALLDLVHDRRWQVRGLPRAGAIVHSVSGCFWRHLRLGHHVATLAWHGRLHLFVVVASVVVQMLRETELAEAVVLRQSDGSQLLTVGLAHVNAASADSVRALSVARSLSCLRVWLQRHSHAVAVVGRVRIVVEHVASGRSDGAEA